MPRGVYPRKPRVKHLDVLPPIDILTNSNNHSLVKCIATSLKHKINQNNQDLTATEMDILSLLAAAGYIRFNIELI